MQDNYLNVKLWTVKQTLKSQSKFLCYEMNFQPNVDEKVWEDDEVKNFCCENEKTMKTTFSVPRKKKEFWNFYS